MFSFGTRLSWGVCALFALAGCGDDATPATDAGGADAGMTDGGATDAGMAGDGGGADAGAADGGSDAGMLDAGFDGGSDAGHSCATDCNDGNPCTTDECDLATGTCRHRRPDADGDGYGDRTCGGGDC